MARANVLPRGCSAVSGRSSTSSASVVRSRYRDTRPRYIQARCELKPHWVAGQPPRKAVEHRQAPEQRRDAPFDGRFDPLAADLLLLGLEGFHDDSVCCGRVRDISARRSLVSIETPPSPVGDRRRTPRRPDGKLYAHATTTCLIFDQPSSARAARADNLQRKSSARRANTIS